jgi:hypothetical protein
MSSRKWLAKHGLAARKLTILDALSPTFIPHQPKYVPIINKHVMSKVFDDVSQVFRVPCGNRFSKPCFQILPIACTSTKRKNLRIVNPQGVNLDVYKNEVNAAMEKFKRSDVAVLHSM